jgi:hypothetical protein
MSAPIQVIESRSPDPTCFGSEVRRGPHPCLLSGETTGGMDPEPSGQNGPQPPFTRHVHLRTNSRVPAESESEYHGS